MNVITNGKTHTTDRDAQGANCLLLMAQNTGYRKISTRWITNIHTQSTVKYVVAKLRQTSHYAHAMNTMSKQLKSPATGEPVWDDNRIEDARQSLLNAARHGDLGEVSRLAQYWLTKMQQDYETALAANEKILLALMGQHEMLRKHMADSINMAAGEYAELYARTAELEEIVASAPKYECPRCAISQPVEEVPATQAFAELREQFGHLFAGLDPKQIGDGDV